MSSKAFIIATNLGINLGGANTGTNTVSSLTANDISSITKIDIVDGDYITDSDWENNTNDGPVEYSDWYSTLGNNSMTNNSFAYDPNTDRIFMRQGWEVSKGNGGVWSVKIGNADLGSLTGSWSENVYAWNQPLSQMWNNSGYGIIKYEKSSTAYEGIGTDFGEYCLAVQGNVLYAGSYSHNPGGSNYYRGMIAKFNISTGAYLGEVAPNNTESWAYYGRSFAMNSSKLVSANYWTPQVEVHNIDADGNSSYSHTISPTVTPDNKFYGIGLAANENYICISNSTAPNNGTAWGHIEVYDSTGTSLIRTLYPDLTKTNGASNPSFGGRVVEISSTNYLLVGDYEGGTGNRGIYYIYNLENGETTAQIECPLDASVNNIWGFIGKLIVVNGETLFITAVGRRSDLGIRFGYVYDMNGLLVEEFHSTIHTKSWPTDTTYYQDVFLVPTNNNINSAGNRLFIIGTGYTYGIGRLEYGPGTEPLSNTIAALSERIIALGG